MRVAVWLIGVPMTPLSKPGGSSTTPTDLTAPSEDLPVPKHAPPGPPNTNQHSDFLDHALVIVDI